MISCQAGTSHSTDRQLDIDTTGCALGAHTLITPHIEEFGEQT